MWASLTASFTTDDAIDLGLDAAGFIPGYGAVFDLAAAYRAWQRGRYLDAALSGVVAVPLFGDAVKLVAVGLGGAVSAYKLYQVADAAHTAARFTERTIDALRHGDDVRSSLASVSRTALGAVDGVAQLGGRRSVADWWRFRSDFGGETVPVGFGAPYTGTLAPLNRLGLRQGYSTVVHNFDAAGSWFARTDTAVHEGFHALVAQHLPSVWRLGDITIGPLPIGAPIKYVEEVLAYGVGHAGALRIHAVPFAPLEAFGSLSRAEAWTTVAFAAAGYGVYSYCNRQ